MAENKEEKDKEKQNQAGIKKKIHSMFDSIFEEENKNVSSSLFRKTSFGPKKKEIFERLKKSPQEILRGIPKSITPEAKSARSVRKSSPEILKKWPFSLLFKKTPQLKGAIGLDIGTSLIKFAHIINIDDKPLLINTKIELIPNEVKSEPSKKENFVIEYIQNVFRGSLKRTPIYLGFNHPELAIELIKIPKVEVKDIPKTVFWKTQEQLSIQDMNTAYLDYLVLGEKEESGENLIYILASVVPRQVILHFVEGLYKMGLDIKAVEPNPLALYALLDIAGELAATELALILDLGASATSLNIVSNKELQFSRELPFSGDTLTKAIADYCKIDFDKAQDLKEKWGSNESSLDTQIGNAVQMHLESLASEIVRTFQYFSFNITKSTVKEMNRMILTGGMSKLNNLDKFLNERLKIPITIFNPLKTVEIDKDKLDLKTLEEDSHKLSVAIGLALRKE